MDGVRRDETAAGDVAPEHVGIDRRRRDGSSHPADVAHARSHRLPGLRHTRGV
jgi:hypothetical protein